MSSNILVYPEILNPPHLVPEYRDWMCMYLGVTGEVIRARKSIRLTEENRTHFRQSYYGKHISTGRLYNYELLYYSSDCWVPGCTGNYFIFRVTPTRFLIVFNIGHRRKIFKLEESKSKWIAIRNFLQRISEIVQMGAEEILLCGHSNGMASATFNAFLLICLARPDIGEYFINQGIIDPLFLENYQEFTEWFKLNNIEDKLVVCGTSGFPVLFRTEEQFQVFYQAIRERYLHIGLATHSPEGLTMDTYMAPVDPPRSIWESLFSSRIIDPSEMLHNFYYHIYAYPSIRAIKNVSKSYYAGLGYPEIEYLGDLDLHEFELCRTTLAWYFCQD
jgi:hypothetical protein